jgi:adenylate kinase family enzyme
MRRVAVIGNSCSGKTTFARRLAERLGVPHVELDALNWGPDWTEAPPVEFRQRVEEAIAGEGWVVDGNYHGKLGDLVHSRADTIVWLDLPLRIALARIWRRTLRRIRTGEELWAGNRETWLGAFWGRDSLLVWTVRHHRRRRRVWPRRLAGRNLVRLRSPAEVEAWLAGTTCT